jgi:ADP-ribosylglycohydrolase
MRPVILSREQYRDKVLACWMGKNIGGTLGAPFEWRRQVNDVTFYTQDLGGEPMPNDDLDIQLLWLVALEERGVGIDAHTLSEYWCLYVTPHWAEYGTAKTNMRSGLLPPLSGTVHNDFKDSCGSFIRAEIWACIAPACPQLAARYAYQDAILDHGSGEGTYAEVFVAAMESAAFVISDLRALIAIGLSYIPDDCGIAQAVHTAIQAYDTGLTWREARDEILRQHRGRAHGPPERLSPEDREKGFYEGKLGYDAPSNIGILILGLLYGGDDFGQMVTTTVNCGEDTDCTGATAGSIFGLMHGSGAIPQNWIEPIGRTIKTVSLNLGELGYFGNQLPQTVDEMTDRTERIARQVLAHHRWSGVQIAEGALTEADISVEELESVDGGASLYASMNGPTFRFAFFDVAIDYGEDPFIRDDEPKMLQVTVHNAYKTQANLSLHWYLPQDWEVSPAADGYTMSLPAYFGPPSTLSLAVRADRVTRTMNRCVLEITIEGRPTAMLVPITLLNGNLID